MKLYINKELYYSEKYVVIRNYKPRGEAGGKSFAGEVWVLNYC